MLDTLQRMEEMLKNLSMENANADALSGRDACLGYNPADPSVATRSPPGGSVR